jgi:hypothetical protein
MSSGANLYYLVERETEHCYLRRGIIICPEDSLYLFTPYPRAKGESK